MSPSENSVLPNIKPKERNPIKRKREPPSNRGHSPQRKRPRTSGQGLTEVQTPPLAPSVGEERINLIRHWICEKSWPREYFEQKSNMSYLRARPKDSRYEVLLATKGSYMGKSQLGIIDASRRMCRRLLEEPQTVPQNSLFRDDIFDTTCERIRSRNETRVCRDIALLIVPSAEIIYLYGATHLECLIEITNEGWNNSIRLTSPRPQPDYAVGFRREAFTEDQLKKLEPFVGDVYATSSFMATYYMYFPFLACEVKCGAAALDIAEIPTGHSTVS
ncbi:MAG: hypothetical protein M1816_004956 [Peltula sp. TS41687]|nr:MAG: hypothetical protein M1816_004956 [Peltula sp. TS41687]